MPHRGVGTMPSCASAGAASAELECHPRCWSQPVRGQDPAAGQRRGRQGWTWPSGCPQPAGPAGGPAVPPPVPRHSQAPWDCARSLAPGVAPGPAAARDPGSQLCPQPPGQGAGAVAVCASSPSQGTVDREGCSPGIGGEGAAVQSVTSTPALSPAAGGLFLPRNVPSPWILAGCRACVTGERLRPRPAGR